MSIKPILNMMTNLVVLCCKLLGFFLLPFFVSVFFFIIYYYLKGKRRRKPKYRRKIKKFSIIGWIFSVFKRLLWDLPQRFVLDWYNKNPDAFNEYGVHIFAGEQGSGKSIAVAEFILRLKKMYPGCKILTNIDFKEQDGKVTSPDDFIMNNNGELGMVVFLDEIQNWFSSMESKNFPPEALEDITQQRKQRKIFLGTSQVFTRVSKPIREQTTLLYKPLTIAGCLTVVRVYKCKLDDSGTVKKEILRKLYFFVHTDEIRQAYDTYERVERLVSKGFKPRSEQQFFDVKFSLSDLDLPKS